MQHSNSIRLLLVFMLLTILASGCATYGPNLDESLRTTKQRIEEAKKDRKLQPYGAQSLYEAELYWQRAWHARRDAAEANHLLFMARGKIAMAQSLAALKNAEEQLASKRMVHTKKNRKQTIAARSNSVDSGGPTATKVVSYDTSRSKALDAQTKNTRRNVVAEEIGVAAKKQDPVSDPEKVGAVLPPTQIKSERSEPSTGRVDPAPAVTPADNREPASSLPGKNEIHSTEDLVTSTSKTVPPAESSPADTVAPMKTVEKDRADEAPAEQATTVQANLPPQPAPQPKEARDTSTAARTQELANLESNAKEAVDAATSEDVRSEKSKDSGSNNFKANIPEYCRNITRIISGGKKVEQKCNELELAAKRRLQRLESHTAIYNYCGNVARALGAGYQILEMCMDQELGSRPGYNDSRKGFVMGDGDKPSR